MSFTPFARYRNFTLENLKSLLEVYPDMMNNISWDDAITYAQVKNSKYKRTAYQQACQFGLEDRSADTFRIHNYLYTFDDENLNKYIEFWNKLYYAPNPHIDSEDEPFIIFVKICDEILKSENNTINFDDFMTKYIGGSSKDILLNALKCYAFPLKHRKENEINLLYIDDDEVDYVSKQIEFIKNVFPIVEAKSEKSFFDRFSYINFCKFYGIDINPFVTDGEIMKAKRAYRTELDLGKSKECARKIIDWIYSIDAFNRFKDIIEDNDRNLKFNTDELGGNYLRYVFARSNSQLYDADSSGKIRVFTDCDYVIDVSGNVEKCRLTTEWVSTDYKGSEKNGNFVLALIDIVNKYYNDSLNIYKEDGRWFMERIVEDFKFGYLSKEFDDCFARRYIMSLLAKPFVILTGNSGAGKTRIAKQFAEHLEVRTADGEKNWALIPVGADWTDNTKVLGFYNPFANEGKGKFEKTEIFKLIERANNNEHIPYFIILDEMNLSHVERYFSDFLSIMETVGEEFKLDGYDRHVKFTKNIFVVGTVNIDETTYMFSPKVLDRANVIEFKPDKNKVMDLFLHPADNSKIESAAKGVAESFLKLSLKIRDGECGLDNSELTKAQGLFSEVYDIISETGYEFAYRTIKEIRQYIAASYELLEDKNEFDMTKAEDEQILQKVLPKIHGSKKEIGEMLGKLKTICENHSLENSKNKIVQMERKLAVGKYASFI